MLYQVTRDGVVVDWTEHESCRYDRKTEASLQKAGYVIYLNGKKLKKVDKNHDE